MKTLLITVLIFTSMVEMSFAGRFDCQNSLGDIVEIDTGLDRAAISVYPKKPGNVRKWYQAKRTNERNYGYVLYVTNDRRMEANIFFPPRASENLTQIGLNYGKGGAKPGSLHYVLDCSPATHTFKNGQF